MARNPRRLAAAAALILTAVLAAACDDGEGADHAGTEAGSPGPPPAPIVYQVRGVYPPSLHRAVIGVDGRAVITTRSALDDGGTRRRVVEVPEGPLAEIRRELAADLASIDDERPRICSDCPKYTVEFGGERVQMFGAGGVPERLRPAIRPLKRALRRASPASGAGRR